MNNPTYHLRQISKAREQLAHVAPEYRAEAQRQLEATLRNAERDGVTEPFHVGQRVTAVLYGVSVTGTITRLGESLEGTTRRGIVWVRWDGQQREQWQHAVSVTPA